MHFQNLVREQTNDGVWQRLGAVFDEPMQLLDKALAALAARPNGNPSLVGGIIWGLDKRSPDLVRLALDRCANDDALRPFLGYLTCRKRITAQDITRIVKDLEAGRLPATELQYFSMGRALDHLEPEDVRPLIEVGLQHADGRSLAIAVLDSTHFNLPDRRKMMNRLVYRALSLQTLLEGKRSHAMVSHHLKQLGLALLNDEEYGSRMAEQVARWTISVCEGDAVHDKMQVISELLSASMTRHFESTWSVDLPKGHRECLRDRTPPSCELFGAQIPETRIHPASLSGCAEMLSCLGAARHLILCPRLSWRSHRR